MGFGVGLVVVSWWLVCGCIWFAGAFGKSGFDVQAVWVTDWCFVGVAIGGLFEGVGCVACGFGFGCGVV